MFSSVLLFPLNNDSRLTLAADNENRNMFRRDYETVWVFFHLYNSDANAIMNG